VLRALAPLLLLAACGDSGGAPPPAKKEPAAKKQEAIPPAPGEAGGLPDDVTPISEAPSAPGGGQGAATVVETYYALIEAGKYRDAWKLRWPAKGDDAEAFTANFEKYASYHANVGAPAEPQAAAGMLYAEVPVQLYGRLKSGESFSSAGSITVRRPAGRGEWRIYGGD